MRWPKFIFLAALVVGLCCSISISNAAPEQQLSVYTMQNSYSLPVLDRGGQPYISLADLFSPLGTALTHARSKEWRLAINNAEARFTEGKEKALIHGDQVNLGGRVLIDEGRVLVPLSAVLPLLGRLLNTTVDFHQPSRRIFVGNAFTHYHAEYKEGDQPSLTLSFSQPVKPEINSDQNHITFIFRKDPVIADMNKQQFGNGVIQSLNFVEENGAASLTVTGNAALKATRSEDGKTIVLKPEASPVAVAPQSTPETEPSAPETQRRGQEFFVMIDPSHGGYDKGASLGGKLMEKDVTLRLARELKKDLEERGIAARLLRDSDIDMALDRRAGMTNEQHAGLYVALHAGYPGKGVRVYTPLLTNLSGPAGRFLPWESAQSSAMDRSKSAAHAVTAELQKKGLTVITLSATLRPLNNIVAPAIAVELTPDGNDGQSLENQKRQNTISSAIASGIAQVRSQMGARP